MTFGEQNTETDGHEQLDFALEQGVNFVDTAEMYSIPARNETYGATEKILGNWFKKTGNRDKVVLASKIAGSGPYTAHIRSTGFSKKAITDAIHGSLQRLQTDYIDLYQLHWPERPVNCFGVRDFPYQTATQWEDNFAEILETLNGFIKAGKIRHIGLSNESPWGAMRYLEESKTKNLPRMITLQNSYSLVHRNYEAGLSEISIRENIGLLAYSPLAFGVLTDKYLAKTMENTRVRLYPEFCGRYTTEQSTNAVQQYAALAQKHGLTLAQLALSFINQLPFVTSTIIGATKINQLKENIESINIDLSQEIIDNINAIHSLMPNPAP